MSTPPEDQARSTDPTGVVFAVGQAWPLDPMWVSERGFRWMPELDILVLTEDDPTPEMDHAFRNDELHLALVTHGPLVGILARFGPTWGWAESMLWWRPDQDLPETFTDVAPGAHRIMQAYLVDNTTKKISSMRVFTVGPHFNQAMCRETADRWRPGTDEAGGRAAFAEFIAKYPTDKALLKGAVSRTRAGFE